MTTTKTEKPDLTIPTSEVRWRVGSTFDRNGKRMGQLLAYIDARVAMERLDLLDPSWSLEHGAPIVAGDTFMGVPARLTVNNITRSDVGTASDMEPIKGAYSDALKRAAVHFGIGRELYEMPRVVVECEVKSSGKTGAPKALPVFVDGKWTIDRAYGYVRYQEVAEQEQKSPAAAAQSADGEAASRAQIGKMFAMAKEVGMDGSDEGKEKLRQLVLSTTGKHSSRQLKSGDMDAIYQALEILKVTGGEMVAA